MQRLVDGFWRTAFRLGHPLAELVWQMTARPGSGAAIAVWHDGRLLCVEESYRTGLGLPGGGCNPGESACAAARRELREEVGLDLEPASFRSAGTVAFKVGRRSIEDALFEVELEAPLPLEIDRREIVWAGFLAPHELGNARRQPVMQVYLERLASLAGAPGHRR